MKQVKSMKYSFRLFEPGPSAPASNNWGLPLNLQICSKCDALNPKMATICTKCGHPLPVARTSTNATVTRTAPAAAMEGEDFSAGKELPDILRDPPAAAAASPPIPDTRAPELMMTSRQFDSFDEQKWLRRTWGLLLLLVVLAAAALLVFSSIQPPSTSSSAARNTGKEESDDNPPMPAPAMVADLKQKTQVVEPDEVLATPAQQTAGTRTSTNASVVESRIVPPTATQERIRSVVPEAPVAPALLQRNSAATANTRCSDAQQALALCNVN